MINLNKMNIEGGGGLHVHEPGRRYVKFCNFPTQYTRVHDQNGNLLWDDSGKYIGPTETLSVGIPDGAELGYLTSTEFDPSELSPDSPRVKLGGVPPYTSNEQCNELLKSGEWSGYLPRFFGWVMPLWYPEYQEVPPEIEKRDYIGRLSYQPTPVDGLNRWTCVLNWIPPCDIYLFDCESCFEYGIPFGKTSEEIVTWYYGCQIYSATSSLVEPSMDEWSTRTYASYGSDSITVWKNRPLLWKRLVDLDHWEFKGWYSHADDGHWNDNAGLFVYSSDMDQYLNDPTVTPTGPLQRYAYFVPKS